MQIIQHGYGSYNSYGMSRRYESRGYGRRMREMSDFTYSDLWEAVGWTPGDISRILKIKRATLEVYPVEDYSRLGKDDLIFDLRGYKMGTSLLIDLYNRRGGNIRIDLLPDRIYVYAWGKDVVFSDKDISVRGFNLDTSLQVSNGRAARNQKRFNAEFILDDRKQVELYEGLWVSLKRLIIEV